MYRKYLEETCKNKFGTLNKAAKIVMRSRAHLFDCLEGRRKLDSVRSLAWTLSSVTSEMPDFDISPFDIPSQGNG